MSDDAPEPGLPGFPAPAPAAGGTYRVIARKYRPNDFSGLIGQDAMVRTLTNAFRSGRIPQAWMLSGVRGVGKTTTARILARALNYELDDGSVTGPTTHMPAMGRHCRAIIESRHMDVMEMDAASHTGVNDVRQIIEGIPYSPVEARYKVFIIDEVHMLSNQAFNAFLKTLEEPPPHVKFVFATTEIRKVPVTILSRCQRFDLKRVDAAVLVDSLRRICAAEGVTVEDEALAVIARAAEGSVRDSQSLLDQAIAHGGAGVAGASVTADTVRAMLGLADHGKIVDLFEAVMAGRVADALAGLKELYDSGADPAVTLTDLAEFTHVVTRVKIVPASASDAALTEVERNRGADFAARLSIRTLSRAWQILLKAIPEVQGSPRPLTAAEMALVRLAHAADLPTPDEALRALPAAGAGGGAGPAAPSTGGGLRAVQDAPRPAATARAELRPAAQSSPRPAPPPLAASPATAALATASLATAPSLRRFEDVVALARSRRDLMLAEALERDVRLLRFEEGRIEFTLAAGGSRTLANDISGRLQAWTGRRWIVALAAGGEASPTLREQAEGNKRDEQAALRDDPLVAAVLARFPGAKIVAVRDNRAAVETAEIEATAPPPADAGDNPPAPADDLAFDADEAYTGDDF